jgi:hypothetical protein
LAHYIGTLMAKSCLKSVNRTLSVSDRHIHMDVSVNDGELYAVNIIYIKLKS